LDFSRLRTGEIVAGLGGIALFAFLFLDWVGGGVEITTSTGPGGAQVPTGVEAASISGWDFLTDLPGFLIMLAGLSGIALAGLAASGRRVNVDGLPRGAVTAGLGTLATLLVLWRMVAGSPELKVGIFLGLAAVFTVAAGGLIALIDEGFEPLVAADRGDSRRSNGDR
jgi:hypothetical protein